MVKQYSSLKFVWALVDARGTQVDAGTSFSRSQAFRQLEAAALERFYPPDAEWKGDWNALQHEIAKLNPDSLE